MRRLITFLGIYPKMTDYFFQDQVYSGQVFAEALCKFLDFDQMMVFTTEKAYENTYPVLEALQDERIIPITIPNGENSDEMWETFEILTNSVEQNDQVIFDITHGLRSIPFLVFLAAAFLKSAKKVDIEAIYYGAFELNKDEFGNHRPAPVIEMSEFISLLDWINASNQFIQFGNATALSKQLLNAMPDYRLGQVDKNILEQRKVIKRTADALDQVSRALRLILPDRAMENSENLQGNMDIATDALAKWARPFSVLSQQVTEAYSPLALSSPRSSENLIASLNREKQLVNWYLERNLLVQAVATAREWIVTWGLLQAGYLSPYDRTIRVSIIEDAFGKALNQRRSQKGAFDDYAFDTGVMLREIPSIVKALDLYEKLGYVRNVLAHAGKQPSNEPAETLERNARQYCDQLKILPLPNLLIHKETP